MKKLMIGFAILGSFSISSCQLVKPDMSDGVVNSNNGHSYQRVNTLKTWQDAKEHCEKQGGYLATLTSDAENRFVYEQVVSEQASKDDLYIWLGGTDSNSEGTWEWITGESWGYEHWGSGYPNDYGKGQDYLAFYGKNPTEWDDAGLPNADPKFPFICEWNKK